jgi:hypothetical protein
MLAARLTAPNRLEIAQVDDPTPGRAGALNRFSVMTFEVAFVELLPGDKFIRYSATSDRIPGRPFA